VVCLKDGERQWIPSPLVGEGPKRSGGGRGAPQALRAWLPLSRLAAASRRRSTLSHKGERGQKEDGSL